MLRGWLTCTHLHTNTRKRADCTQRRQRGFPIRLSYVKAGVIRGWSFRGGAMFKARLSPALSILALGATLGLAGCAGVGTVRDQIAAADVKLRATKPMTEWLDVRPEYLAEVDP